MAKARSGEVRLAEKWVCELIMVVEILIAEGEAMDTLGNQLCQFVLDEVRIARVVEARCRFSSLLKSGKEVTSGAAFFWCELTWIAHVLLRAETRHTDRRAGS